MDCETVEKLTPEEREQIIEEYKAGKEISNKNYYVVKSKNDVLYVRRRKNEKKKDGNYLTLKQAEGSFKIPIKSTTYSDGFLTIEQENAIFKIPAEEVKKENKQLEEEVAQLKEENKKLKKGVKEAPAKEKQEEGEKRIKPKAL